MKTDGFEMANRRTARHAVQWQPLPPEEGPRPMDLGDVISIAAVTALIFTLGAIVTCFCVGLMG